MSSVETDPQLNSMLLQNRIADLDKVTTEFNEFVEKYRLGVSTKILDMGTLILASEPKIKSISFAFSAGEYNDNTYDGFSVGDPNVMVHEAIHVKSQYGDYTVEPDEWFWFVDCRFRQDIAEAIKSLASFVNSMKMFISDEYGSRVRLVIDSNGLSEEAYDSGV